MASVLKQAYFHDEAAAFAALEGILWPHGPVCPHCGCTDRINRLEGVKDKKGRIRLGLWKCYHCRGQFTVRKGTVFEASHLKLHQWFQAAFLLCSSKKGISSHQLARTLGCTVKTAWFASHRIREAMRAGKLTPLGGKGKIVEADETYIADSEKKIYAAARKRGQVRPTKNIGPHYKRKVLALVERGGDLRSFHVDEVTSAEVAAVIRKNVSRESAFMTDEGRHYRQIGSEFTSHERVHHTAKEYVRGDVHVNTLEGYFSIFKRGMSGIYQHCAEKHLHRYLAEFDFRYNNRIAIGVDDVSRTVHALLGAKGKRLTYRRTGSTA